MFGFGRRALVKSGLLEGWVDLHSHVLWGVDDGVRSEAMARETLLALQYFGVSRHFATPHIMGQVHRNDELEIRAAFDERLAPLALELGLEISLAAEYMLDNSFLAKLKAKQQLLTLDGHRVLVELPMADTGFAWDDIFMGIEDAGYSAVLAHPERYSHLMPSDMALLKERGVELQLNILSLSGFYGNWVKDTAFDMLKSGLYDFVGSDAHNLRMAEHVKMINLTRSERRYFAELMERSRELLS